MPIRFKLSLIENHLRNLYMFPILFPIYKIIFKLLYRLIFFLFVHELENIESLSHTRVLPDFPITDYYSYEI